MADVNIYLRRNLSSPTFANNVSMIGVPPAASPTESVIGEVHWKDADDPDMGTQPLGEAVVGHTLSVPFDLKGRTLQLFLVSKTADGVRSVNLINNAVQATFATGVAALSALSFSAPDVTGTIANNAGTGTIRILRKLSTDDAFSEIQNVTPSTTTFTDTPAVNGDYAYKLTQDGLDGESNMLSVTVTGAGGGTGTPPDSLSGTFDGIDDISLSWTNHGGTGGISIERRIGSSGSWTLVGTGISTDTTFDDFYEPGQTSVVLYYRVSNDAVTGYSNETALFIPRGV